MTQEIETGYTIIKISRHTLAVKDRHELGRLMTDETRSDANGWTVTGWEKIYEDFDTMYVTFKVNYEKRQIPTLCYP